MRFAIALVTLVLAAGLVVAGIAQRTVLRPADHVSLSAEIPSGARYAVVPAAVLQAHPGRQRLRLDGSGVVFAAYGRSADLRAWLAGERYAQLGVDGAGAPVQPVLRRAPALPGVASSAVVDPDGSDLWVEQRVAQRHLDWSVDLPASMSLIIAADGRASAPSRVDISWPNRASTPLAVPMIVGGGGLAVVGLLLYVWALVHVRRRRGPRRTPPPKMPRRPQPPRYRPVAPVATGPGRGRRSVRRSHVHRLSAVLGGLAAAGSLLVPAAAAQAAPAVPPAVTERQAQRIVESIGEVAARADAARDATALAQRFAGPALALRTAQYRILKKDRRGAKQQPIPHDGARFRLILPEATASWPRTLFVVAEDPDPKVAPVALTLVQDDPRSDYRAHYAMSLIGGLKLPVLPSATTGTNRLRPDAAVLRVTPAELGSDYGEVLRNRDAEEASAFDLSDDQLERHVGEAAKRKAARQLGSTARITFHDLATDPSSIVAMSTADAGALVSVQLAEQWKVQPKRSGVTVRPSGGTRVLAKTTSTSKGITSVYGYQLLFAVPSAGSEEPVQLLGYAQGLVSAKES